MSFLVDRKDILQWSNGTSAGYDFPRLLRSIISHDNDAITHLDMRASEGARLSGYDGEVRAKASSTLVPEGHSVWELGVEASPSSKATKDIDKRVKNGGDADLSQITYIAATSRSWPGKAKWAMEQRERGIWLDVRAYDVDDLCGALDRDTLSALLFCDIADRRGIRAETAEHWWSEYSRLFAVPLTPELVVTGRAVQVSQLRDWLAGKRQTIEVRAPSDEDGRAFIASALDVTSDSVSDLIICDDAPTARDLIARSPKPLIFVTTIDHGQLVPLGEHRAIKINTAGPSPITLPKQNTGELTELLKTAGLDHADADKYGAAARRSFYRYRVDFSHATHPLWNTEFADRRFRLLWLLGSWQQGGETYEILLRSAFSFGVEDAVSCVSNDVNSADPIFSHVGDTWRVTAPRNSAQYFTERSDMVEADLSKFVSVVLEVLGEADPALELPEDKRYMANIMGKSRRYSLRLRQSVATSLAVLASECGSQPLSRGLTIQCWVDQIVSELFHSGSSVSATWASLSDVLTVLAEASPETLLEQLRQNLNAQPEEFRSLRSASQASDILGAQDYLSPILWSLHSLLWSPDHCERAMDVLVELALVVDSDSKSPSAAGILHDGLHPTMPQCALDAQGRVAAIESCAEKAPTVAKKLCEKFLRETHGFIVVHTTHFRPWAGDKQSVTWADAFTVYFAIIRTAICLTEEFPELWSTLVKGVEIVGARGFDAITDAFKSLGTEDPSAFLVWRDVHRTLRRHRRHSDTDWAMPEEYLQKLENSVDHLEPAMARQRHDWLFGASIFDLDLDLEDTRGDDSKLLRLQSEAVRAILEGEGFDGLVELARAHPNGIWAAGVVLARGAHDSDPDVMSGLLISDDPGLRNFARGYFVNCGIHNRLDLLEFASAHTGNATMQARLLLAHDNEVEAWERARLLGSAVEGVFWSEFQIYGRGVDFSQAETVARRLLECGRVSAALDVITLYKSSIDTTARSTLIVEGLQQLVTQPPEGGHRLPSTWEFRELLSLIRSDSSIDRGVICQLELALLPALDFNDDEPLAIEVEASNSAPNFMFLIDLAFKSTNNSDDDGESSGEFRVGVYRVLNEMRYAPTGGITCGSLLAWISEVKALATDSGRLSPAMQSIGQILARVKRLGDQPYPDPVILAALEASEGNDMLSGFKISLFNSRGVVWRGRGGQQEYELAEKYEEIAREIKLTAPRASTMFEQIAKEYRWEGAREDEREERVQDGIDAW